MVNGLIQDIYWDDFEFMWDHMGKMYATGVEANASQDRELGWDTFHSRLMMTDPSFTMAANNQDLIKKAQDQRSRISEVVFESLGVSELSLLPA